MNLIIHRRSDDERDYRPPRRSSQYDDDDEPTEAELETIRAEYMGFPPREAILEVRV